MTLNHNLLKRPLCRSNTRQVVNKYISGLIQTSFGRYNIPDLGNERVGYVKYIQMVGMQLTGAIRAEEVGKHRTFTWQGDKVKRIPTFIMFLNSLCFIPPPPPLLCVYFSDLRLSHM